MAALLDFEIYDSRGQKVYQKFLDRRSLVAGRTTTVVFTWAIPPNLPAGTYTVKLGVFSPGWGTLHHWNDRAATFTVSARTAAMPSAPNSEPNREFPAIAAGNATDHLASVSSPRFIPSPSGSSTTTWFCGQEPRVEPARERDRVAGPEPVVLRVP